MMSQLTPTSTHSSTLMTPLTVTSSSTGMEPTLLPRTTMPIQETLSTVFLLVRTVPESTHSSTHLMLLTNKLVCSLVTKLVFSSSELQPLHVQLQFSSLASSSQLNQSSKLSLLRQHHHQETSSLLASSSLTGLSPDSTLTSPPSKRLKVRQDPLVLVKCLTDVAVRSLRLNICTCSCSYYE